MNIKLKIGDILIIVAIVALSIGIFLFTKKGATAENATRYVSIQIDGEEVERIPLTEDTEETIVLDTEYGHNVIEIKDNSVKSIEADCPDQLDVLQGAIYEPGELIVCLPNRMVVEIIDIEEAHDLDVVNQ